MDSFQRYHAAVNLIYFIVVITNTFMFMNPILISMNLLGLILYDFHLAGGAQIEKLWKLSAFIMCMAMLVNPIFNHQGETVLTYFMERPITYESIIFGVVSAFFLFSMIILFHLFQKVMSAEKCTVLFGNILPKFAMIFSMGIHLIPKLSREFEQIKRANKGIQRIEGKSPSKKHDTKTARQMKYILVLIGSSLEDSIDTADSMSARGYLLKEKKTHMSDPFSKRDVRVTVLFAILISIMVVYHDKVSAIYFPKLILPECSLENGIYYVSYFVFINIPMILNVRENRKWHRIQTSYFK